LFSGLVVEEWWKVGLLSVGGPCTVIQYSKTDRGIVTVKITVSLGGGKKKKTASANIINKRLPSRP